MYNHIERRPAWSTRIWYSVVWKFVDALWSGWTCEIRSRAIVSYALTSCQDINVRLWPFMHGWRNSKYVRDSRCQAYTEHFRWRFKICNLLRYITHLLQWPCPVPYPRGYWYVIWQKNNNQYLEFICWLTLPKSNGSHGRKIIIQLSNLNNLWDITTIGIHIRACARNGVVWCSCAVISRM